MPRVISTDMAQKARQIQGKPEGNDTPAASLVSASYQFSGPIPSPQDLANYENVMPGLADRIITRFERQSEHRMELEKCVTRTNALRANLGLAAGLIVSLAGLGAAAILGLHGHDWAAGVVSVADLGVLAGVFVYGSNNQKHERLERARLMLGHKSGSQDSTPGSTNEAS